MSDESKMRPASEIAAEIVPSAGSAFGTSTSYIVHGQYCIELLTHGDQGVASCYRDALRQVFVDVIEQARRDGAVEALREVASRLDPFTREAREVSGSYHEHGDGEGAALESGKSAAYHHVAHVARELAARPRKT